MCLCFLLLPYLALRRRRLEKASRAPIVILYYHGIGNGAENWMTLPLEEFHRQVTYLASYFKILDLEEAVKRLRSGRNHETSVVLTFDDGYANCYRNLLPYISFYDIPITMFVCSGAIRDQVQLPHDSRNGYEKARVLTPHQVQEFCRHGSEVGSHALDHEDVAKEEGPSLEAAVIDSAAVLENMTGGQRVRYFSFPRAKYCAYSREEKKNT